MKKAVAKAKRKAFGTVSYAEPERKYGVNLSAKDAKSKRGVERAAKAGANVERIRFRAGGETINAATARKVDVDASKKKVLKASGKTFKATAAQMQSDRSRAANRASGIAKREASKKQSRTATAAKQDRAASARGGTKKK